MKTKQFKNCKRITFSQQELSTLCIEIHQINALFKDAYRKAYRKQINGVKYESLESSESKVRRSLESNECTLTILDRLQFDCLLEFIDFLVFDDEVPF